MGGAEREDPTSGDGPGMAGGGIHERRDGGRSLGTQGRVAWLADPRPRLDLAAASASIAAAAEAGGEARGVAEELLGGWVDDSAGTE